MTASTLPADQTHAGLLDKQAVAKMFGCSTRHIDRLTDDGRMPQPVRIGKLVRWRCAEIEDWISAGCPPMREATT